MTGDRPDGRDRPRGRWPRLWAAWGALVVASFFAIEVPALVNDSGGDTLTENLQNVFDVAGPGWGVAALALASAWLGHHFFGPESRIWRWRHERAVARETDDR